MSRHKRRATNSVSLFPFLAVLVCAMGALIFLLIVTTSRIRSEAIAQAERAAATQAEAEEELVEQAGLPADSEKAGPEEAADAGDPEPPEPEPFDPDDEWRNLVEKLSRQRDDRRRRLDARRAVLSATRRRIDESEAAFDRIEQKLHEAEQKRRLHEETEQTIDDEQAGIEAQIEDTERQIGRLRKQKAEASSKYTIVPFDGSSGTTRRPIFIECTDEGLRFLPEDILLTEADLEGFTGGYNPLLAGARTLVKYWSTRNRMQPESQREPEPYVLLLVRPSGTVSYYYGRKLLESLGTPSGYELLEEDRELEYPEADPQATAVCREAIDQVLAERDKLKDTLAARGGQTGRTVRFRKGVGFEVEEADSGSFGGGRSGLGRGSSAGDGSAASGTQAGGAGRAVSRGTGRPLEGGDSSIEDSRGFAGRGRAPTGRGGFAAERDGSGERGTGEFERSVARAGEGDSPAVAGGAGTNPGSLQGSASKGEEGGTPPYEANRRPAGFNLDGVAAPGPSSDVPGGEEGSGSSANQPADPSPLPEHPLASERSGAGRNMSTGSAAGSAGGKKAEGATGSNRGNRGAPPGSASAGSGSGSGGAGNASPSFAPPPFDQTSPRSSSSRPQSRRWGESSRRASIGFERPVTVRVTTDRVQVGNEPPIPLGKGETIEELSHQLLQAIDDHVRTWGRPPENFYWVPAVRFEVNPGGNQYYERLRGPLRRWGVSSSVEYKLETSESPMRGYEPSSR